jgi:hypothetical protein
VQAFDPKGIYSDQAVIEALQGKYGGRTIDFRYERLSSANVKLSDLTGMLSGSVAYAVLDDIKRTGSFELRDGVDVIDYLKDRIKPYVRLQMPDGGWVEWPQGVFLLSSPKRVLHTTGEVGRSVTAYDQLVVLSGDLTSDRYSIPAGRRFDAAILDIAAGFTISLTPTVKVLPAAWDYPPGTSKLSILNDLLGAINYRGAWFDENGVLICQPYVLPDTVSPGYTYATDSTSVIVGDVQQDLDLFAVPNRWTLVVSDTDQPALSSTVTNSSATSPTSTVSRGRVISQLLDGQTAADQATLDALAAKQAYQDSQVYEHVEFQTAIMPFHSNADVLGVSVTGLQLGSVKFEEMSWGFDLKAGALMSHTVRRTISTNGGA